MNETVSAVTEVKQVIAELMPYLEQAAEKIGTTAQYLWMLQIKQAYIAGASGILRYIVWAIAIGIWIKVSNRIGDIEARAWCFVIGTIIFAIIYAFLPSYKEILTVFFNPEYWALQQVIILLKGSVR